MKLPQEPNKDRIITLLNPVDTPCPNWTPNEQQEVAAALSALAYLWFRTEDCIIK